MEDMNNWEGAIDTYRIEQETAEILDGQLKQIPWLFGLYLGSFGLIQDASAQDLKVWAYESVDPQNPKQEYQNWLARGIHGLIIDHLPEGLSLLHTRPVAPKKQ